MTITFASTIALLSRVSAISQTACASLWRASWQAGLAALTIWAICRAFPRLPASTRCWLWRLTLLKFVLTLLLPSPAIFLPVLPRQAADAQTAVAAESTGDASVATVASFAVKEGLAAPLPTAAHLPEAGTTTKNAAETPAVVAFGAQARAMRNRDVREIASTDAAPTMPIPAHGRLIAGQPFGALSPLLFAFYLAGVAVCLVRLVRCGLQTQRFLRVPRRAIGDFQVAQEARSLCGRLGIRRVPALREAPDVEASQLVAAFPPVVLLPVLSGSSRDETPGAADRDTYRLMLAHELAHLRRGDLWWSGFAALTHTLFFFHPLLWLARREEELAREMACDALVLAVTAAAPSRYGALLVEVAARRGQGFRSNAGGGAKVALASLGFADEIALVRQRLNALKTSATPLSPRRLRLLVGTAGTAALMALMPWRLASAHGPAGDQPTVHALAAAALMGIPPLDSVQGVVEGRVSLLPDNEAGANSVVHLDPIDGHAPLKINHVPTDVEGQYRFEGVPAGEYRLWTQPSEDCIAAVSDKSSLHIRVSSSQPAIHQDLLLTKNTVSIIGQVFDRRSGQFVDDVQVGAGTIAGGPESVVVWQSTRFSYRGYHLHVASGSTALYVRYGHDKPVVIPGVNFGTYPANPYRLLPSDTPRVNRVVEATSGHALRADLVIDAHYVPRDSAAKSLAPITGRVVGADGRPAAGVGVYFFNIIRTVSQQQFPARPTVVRTDAQGQFRLEGIPLNWAGNRVDIRARDTGGTNEQGGLSPHLVVTMPRNRTDALAPLALHLVSGVGTDVAGQVVDSAGHPVAYVPVSINCMGDKWESLAFDEATVTDAQGRYHFRQVWSNFGGWLISEPDASHIGDLMNWDKGLKMAGHQGNLPPMVLKPITQQIAGVVVTPEGKPVPHRRLMLFCLDRDNVSGGDAETDLQGRFRVDNLGSGTYEVYYGDGKSLKITKAHSGDKHLRLIVKSTAPARPRSAPVAKFSTTNQR